MVISQKLHNEAKLSDTKHYQLAHKAGLHPSTFSRILNGIERIKENDPRVLAIGRVLGVPAEDCFQEDTY